MKIASVENRNGWLVVNFERTFNPEKNELEIPRAEIMAHTGELEKEWKEYMKKKTNIVRTR